MAIEKKELQDVRYRMDYEGFDYCFRNYSDFSEIKDEEFHKLKEAYIAAADALEKYIKDFTFGEEDR